MLLSSPIVPSFLGETHFAALEYSLLFRWTPERRQLDYLRYVGASDDTAKEVQLFGLARLAHRALRVLSERYYDENRKLATRKAPASARRSRSSAPLGYYGAYVVIICARRARARSRSAR